MARFSAPASRPFFAYVSFTLPHAGRWGDDKLVYGAPVPTDLQFAVESKWPEVERDHAAMIAYADRCVGQLVRSVLPRSRGFHMGAGQSSADDGELGEYARAWKVRHFVKSGLPEGAGADAERACPRSAGVSSTVFAGRPEGCSV